MTGLGSASAMQKDDGSAPIIARYLPFGGYRGGNGPNEVTDRGFTGHKHNDDLGLVYMNARFYVSGIGRFASADSIVPDPARPQSYNRYSYVENRPLNLFDPSGHCPGTPGDGINDACWNYLMGTGSNSFCQGAGIDICGTEGWQRWLEHFQGSCYSAYSCNMWFEAPWSLSELQTLQSAIAAMINALGNIGIDWRKTPLQDTKYSKDYFPLANPWANPFTHVIHLVSVNERSIWHETAHNLDFGSIGSLNDRFAQASGNCTNHGMGGNLCSNTSANGYYYRDYGWNAGAIYGTVYGMLFNQHETFADAFAAWVYHDANGGTDPVNWISGRAASTGNTPQWAAIYNAVNVVLSDAFK